MSVAAVLTDRFDRALLYATHVHGGQVRKGTSTPYVAISHGMLKASARAGYTPALPLCGKSMTQTP
jgi:hypothetical protein